MVSTAPGSSTAGDVKHLTAIQTGTQIRVQFTLDATRVNTLSNWPTYGLSAQWKGIKFHNVAGIWLHALDLTSAPTYDAVGKLTAWPAQAWPTGRPYFDTGIANVVLTAVCPSTSDFGDYLGFPTAAQVPDTNLRIGTLATDAESVLASNATATGDDLVGDDEDLTMPASPVGTATNLVIPITDASAIAARVIVFVDWNGDGDVH